MDKPLFRGSLIALATVALAACTATTSAPTAVTAEDSAPADSWLQGSVNERLETVADQLRGFGITMLEVDHRYGELYFAGQDRNWEYAAYQIEEIEEALEAGLQRRPARAESAAMLDPALEAVEEAVDDRDPAAFEETFERLTATCNACHLAEDVAFIHVAPPVTRGSSVRPAGPGSNAERD